MGEVNKKNDEILLKLLEQHWLHCRHLENERAAFMAVYAALTGGTLAFMAAKGFGVWALLFLLVITLFGLFLTMRWIYAFENHRQRVNWIIREINHPAKICEWPLVNLMTMNIPPMKLWPIPVRTRFVFPFFYLIMFLFLGVLLISNINNLLTTATSTKITDITKTTIPPTTETTTKTTTTITIPPNTDTPKDKTEFDILKSKISDIWKSPVYRVGVLLLFFASVFLVHIIIRYNCLISKISKLYVTDVMITWTPDELKSWINRYLKLKKTPLVKVDYDVVEMIYQWVKMKYEQNPGDPVNETEMSKKIEQLLP